VTNSYENPPIPEGINVGRDKPLVEFLRLAAGLALFVVVVSAVLYFAGGSLARLIPFSTERSWVDGRIVGIEAGAATGDRAVEIQAYLQELTDRIAAQMDLPPDMALKIHYLDMAAPNAFASLGGQLGVTSGLYARMQSENGLALVLAHEIAHAHARDPISNLGGGVAMLIVLALLTGNADAMSGTLAALVQRGYSRRAEESADAAAIAAMRKLYGHVGGGAAVFETLAAWRAEKGMELPSLLSTHPLDDARIARLRAAAGSWHPAVQPLVPLKVPTESPKD
jgi:Zn-dependent protease with chaperone function